MTSVTLRQLRYLSALARYRHFGRAAESCAISQPALSMQIRDLEQSLCANVVERRPGDVILTEVGVAIAARAEAILTAVNDLVDVAMHHSQTLVGRLRLGVIPTIAPYVLPGILPELQQRYPELRLEVRETQTQTLLDELSSGALDAVLLALPLEDDQHIETRALIEDRLLLAVPANDESYGNRIRTRDVDQLRLILLEKGHCLRDQTLAFCATPRWANTQKRGETRLDASSLATVTQMVANGYGVTLLPEIATNLELRDNRVKVVRFHDPEPSRIIGLAWRRTSPRVQDFQALGDIIVEMFAKPRDE
jgi:LysR family transcriptional regulator, hydrogen peroxide-inducible genes activator